MKTLMRFSALTKIALVVVGVAILVACGTVPLTGRTQMTLVSDANLNTLSVNAYQDVLKDSQLSRDQDAVASIRRVGNRLAQSAEQFMHQRGQSTREYDWEFNLIEDDAINAWAMPGGKIAFYTGILPITQDDNGIAVVMSHEIAHVLARHGNERMSQQLAVQMGGASLSYAMRQSPEQTANLAKQVYGAGATVGLLLPYSRTHEAEADRIGLSLMAMAGYDPREAVPFWTRMNDAHGGGARPPEFLSTHPAPTTRIDNINAYLPEALALYQPR